MHYVSHGAREGEPGFVGAIQIFGNLIDQRSHVHAIVSGGLFLRDGFFIRITKVDMEHCTEVWRERVSAVPAAISPLSILYRNFA
jgi:hypothetical protein